MQVTEHDDPKGCPQCGCRIFFRSEPQEDKQWYGYCANQKCGVLFRGTDEGDGRQTITSASE